MKRQVNRMGSVESTLWTPILFASHLALGMRAIQTQEPISISDPSHETGEIRRQLLLNVTPTPVHNFAMVLPALLHLTRFIPPLLRVLRVPLRIPLKIPWRPLKQVAVDTVKSTLLELPSLLPLSRPDKEGVPVYVMLPLDVALSTSQISPSELEVHLRKLKDIGVTGVMLDVWWGLCEPLPGVYVFDRYVELIATCGRIGLLVQATMSFHACGGSIGDDVNIPLPEWVVQAGDMHTVWFTDHTGFHNREYISFGADHVPFLPASQREKDAVETVDDDAAMDASLSIETVSALGRRTPLQAYASFLTEFVHIMTENNLMKNVITELQVGMGPCGELRYPSYPMTEGMWKFPGIGEFQCFDKYLMKDLQDHMRENGTDDIMTAVLPPDGMGSYNDKPWDTDFFKRGYKTEADKFFVKWYSDRMLLHAEDILKMVRDIVPVSMGVSLAVKISGIHWWFFHSSRAAEATAGYIQAPGVSAYAEIAKLFKRYDVVFDFTCLEMRSIDQPLLSRCGPRQLVREVFDTAKEEGVQVAGENALERFDRQGLGQIVMAFKRTKAKRYGFTLLRLGRGMMEENNLKNVKRFVSEMKKI